MTWKEELNNILIEYDFNKDAPGTFDFVEAEKKLTALIERLLKKQRDNIIEINRVMWLDYFDDETTAKEQMEGVNKYYERMKSKLNNL